MKFYTILDAIGDIDGKAKAVIVNKLVDEPRLLTTLTQKFRKVTTFKKGLEVFESAVPLALILDKSQYEILRGLEY